MNNSIVTSEDASKAVGNLYLMVILASERARQIRKTKRPFPMSEAILETEQNRLDVPKLLKNIQKRK